MGVNLVYFDIQNYCRRFLTEKLKSEFTEINLTDFYLENDFLENLEQKKFDILILDFFSFSKNAIENIIKIRIKNPDKIIIVLSNYNSEILKEHCIKAGANLFIEKESDEFIRQIFTLIKNEFEIKNEVKDFSRCG